MEKTVKLSFSSSHSISKEELWNAVCTFKELNKELSPVLKMTSPKCYYNKRLEDFPANEFVFYSIILLFCFIPIDRYNVRLVKVIKNDGFMESSTSIFTSEWIHIRKIKEIGNTCLIKDELEVTPRNIIFRPFVWLLIKTVFYTRHKNIAKKVALINASIKG